VAAVSAAPAEQMAALVEKSAAPVEESAGAEGSVGSRDDESGSTTLSYQLPKYSLHRQRS